MEYPKASSIQFPDGKTPYAQQLSLMKAVLDTCKAADDELLLQQAEQKSTTGANNNNDDSKKLHHRAKVLIAESPTGTGKSLSLACASLTWLKYRERVDLLLMDDDNDDHCVSQSGESSPSANNNNNNNNNNVISPSSVTDRELDWLDLWMAGGGGGGGEQTTNQEVKQEKEREEKVATRAREARQRLEKELNKIRTIMKSNNNNDREDAVRVAITKVRMKERNKNHRSSSVKRSRNNPPTTIQSEEDFCAHEYNSDGDDGCISSSSSEDESLSDKKQEKLEFSTSDLLAGGQLDGSNYQHHFYEDEKSKRVKNMKTTGFVAPGTGVRKVVYAARTHSQLSQFINEIKRTSFAQTDASGNERQSNLSSSGVKVLALGGRKVLCGNDDVLYSNINNKVMRSEAMINEHCLDLLKSKKPSSGNKRTSSSGCPLLASRESVSTLALHMAAAPSDIEDLRNLGQAGRTCSYYASREALPGTEVVAVPYPLLLSKKARESINLSLKGALVIIDEAHNIPETLCNLASANLSLPIVEAASDQLDCYLSRYKERLASKNLVYIGQISKCLKSFKKVLKNFENESSAKSKMLSSNDFIFESRLDNVNWLKVDKFLTSSRLPQKLLGFHQSKIINKEKDSSISNNGYPFLSKHVSPMAFVQDFFRCLSSSSSEGKIVLEMHENDGSTYPNIRYVLLSPASRFESILDEAHVVVLAGGTMRPFAHVASEILLDSKAIMHATSVDKRLSAGLSANHFTANSPLLDTFVCGHVVSSSNVQTIYLSQGPTGNILDFRHKTRNSDSVCDEFGRVLINSCKIIPEGLVVFLPSYKFCNHIVCRWRKCGIWGQLKQLKRVYIEPKDPRDVDKVLEAYSNDAESSLSSLTTGGGGALLLCVVGGKMSEGINFANGMARGVVVAGLPYPDITSPELKKKMEIMDSNDYGISGQVYYHNLCMRAVNQSIGRAIRHKNDYAAVILADYRYISDERVWLGLPEWLRGCTKPRIESFGQTVKSLTQFFKHHRCQ